MNSPIQKAVDQLPTGGLTVLMLRAIDSLAPSQWKNTVGFANTIAEVTGADNQDLVRAVGDRAIYLFNDCSQGYKKALWLYKSIDATDKLLGIVEEQFSYSLLGFLNSITPRSEKTQIIDLVLKLVAEIVAFWEINRTPDHKIQDFLIGLGGYSGESILRMVTLICVEGLIPLGPDFINKALSGIEQMAPQDLDENATFNWIKDAIPGEDDSKKLDFIGESFNSVTGWMNNVIIQNNLTPQTILASLKNLIDFGEDKQNSLAAFIDVSTTYYEHTGTQTIARRLIERSWREIELEGNRERGTGNS